MVLLLQCPQRLEIHLRLIQHPRFEHRRMEPAKIAAAFLFQKSDDVHQLRDPAGEIQTNIHQLEQRLVPSAPGFQSALNLPIELAAHRLQVGLQTIAFEQRVHDDHLVAEFEWEGFNHEKNSFTFRASGP
jgi:hypothetical protein